MAPSWNIAVHQLECPHIFGRALSLNDQNMETKTNVQRVPRSFVSDWLAPSGCMQYYVQPTGSVETFNLANGVGKLLFIDNHSYVEYSFRIFLNR